MNILSQQDDSFIVVLPVFNGAAHLRQQLDSIAAQSDQDWRLFASDDGSTDNSVSILQAFATRFPDQVTLLRGPRQGLTAHITKLLDIIPDGAGPIALCDQDDIWLEDRLAADRALIAGIDPDVPALVCRRTRLCDKEGNPLGLSPARPRPPSFGNALVQNIASGNTMVLNRALCERLQSLAKVSQGVAYHDWWIYQVVTGIGGDIHFDPDPKILYRQHASNLVGVPRGLSGMIQRTLRLLSGAVAQDGSTHLDALATIRKELTPEAQRQLDALRAAQSGGVTNRVRNISKSGIYRQSRRETLVIWLAALVGRL